MSIYIAGKYTAKDRLARHRETLRNMGFDVTSSWMDEVYESDQDSRITDLVRRRNAMRDFEEVMDSDIFILDTADISETGGREVELGLALVESPDTRVCCRVGPYRNVFHTLVDHVFSDWEELIMWIAQDHLQGV